MHRRFSLAILVLTATSAFAGDDPPLPDSQLGRRTAPVLLLTRPDVLADLGMTPEQAKIANKTATDFWLRADALKKRPNENPSQQTIQQRHALNQEMQAWLDGQLSPPQKERLSQIDLWWEGPSALVSRPYVAEHLRLTPDQRAALRQALDEREQAKKIGPTQAHELAAKAMKVLTPEQLLLWKELLGREFVPRLAAANAHPLPVR